VRKILPIAMAALLAGVTSAYAGSGIAVDGTYSLSYSPTIGAASNMSFSSAPGDGAVSGESHVLGTQSMSGQSVTNNPFFLDGLAHTGEDTLSTLTVGTPYTTNFFTASPAGTCTGCVNHIASGTITATFAFTLPSSATGTLTTTATYSANYSGTLACSGTANPADCVVWNQPDPLTVNFTDGAVMTVQLNNAQDWAITPTVTFTMTRAPTPAPEPASLVLLGSAIVGMGLLKRYRKAA